MSSESFAKEYKFTKRCNPGRLAEELKNAGINLLGLSQIGYMNTTEGKNITIIIKQGSINETVLNQVVNDHIYKTEAQLKAEKKAKKKVKEDNIKLKLGLTSQDFQDLKEALSD